MTRLMASAGITPRITPVRSGEAELSRITGAQAPSGVPVVITAPAVERPRRASGSSPSRNRRSRTGQGGRPGQGRPAGAGTRRGTQRRPGNDAAA
jgi:hypothetical protein